MGTSYRARFYRRIQDAMREVGTLLIAFAPLDVGLQGSEGRVHVLAFFLVLGVLLFVVALTLEWRLEFHDINEIVGFGGVALLGLIGYIVAVRLVPINRKKPKK